MPFKFCRRLFMPKGRIVVVEDEPAIRRGVVDALRLTGYEVSEAADGAVGLQIAVQPNIDLILLDLLLPVRDGLEVLSDLRKICPTRPVIILTARGTEEDRVRGLKMGADDYVVKPFSARELLAREPSTCCGGKFVGRGLNVTNCQKPRRSCCSISSAIAAGPSRVRSF
jgi:CheY-like chemotaxis protein